MYSEITFKARIALCNNHLSNNQPLDADSNHSSLKSAIWKKCFIKTKLPARFELSTSETVVQYSTTWATNMFLQHSSEMFLPHEINFLNQRSDYIWINYFQIAGDKNKRLPLSSSLPPSLTPSLSSSLPLPFLLSLSTFSLSLFFLARTAFVLRRATFNFAPASPSLPPPSRSLSLSLSPISLSLSLLSHGDPQPAELSILCVSDYWKIVAATPTKNTKERKQTMFALLLFHNDFSLILSLSLSNLSLSLLSSPSLSLFLLITLSSSTFSISNSSAYSRRILEHHFCGITILLYFKASSSFYHLYYFHWSGGGGGGARVAEDVLHLCSGLCHYTFCVRKLLRAFIFFFLL